MSRSPATTAQRLLGAALGEEIRIQRQRLGLSGEQLARESLCSVETIRRLERGLVNSPGLFLAAQIAAAIGVELSDLVDLAIVRTENKG